MSQRESRLSRQIMKALRLEGWFCFKVHGNEHMMSGLPDIICCAEGYFFGLETKYPGEEDDTSARQDFVHEQIRAANGVAAVVTTPDEAVEVVRAGLKKFRSC